MSAKLSMGFASSENRLMFATGISSTAIPVVALALILFPQISMAQHHGGHGMGGTIPGGSSRPTGVDEKDDLKDFHRALAIQATPQQIADFQVWLKETDTAKAGLQRFQPQSMPGIQPAGPAAPDIDQLLDHSHTHGQKFTGGLSAAQKSGLKDALKKLSKADTDLQATQKRFDEIVMTQKSAELQSCGESLARSLSDFSDQQLALGREMGMVLAESSDVTFSLAEIKNPIPIGSQTFFVAVSGELSQIAAQGGERTFKLEVTADLSDLQQNISDFLRSQMKIGANCGERLEIRDAAIVSSASESTVTLQLHYERWACSQIGGQRGAQELAEGEGSVQVKLTPEIEKGNAFRLATGFSRIDAGGIMGESLRSGNLGQQLRDELSHSLLSAIQTGVDFAKSLPPVVRDLAVIQSMKFQDAGIGRLGLVFDGKIEASDAQISVMASQLNQATLAKGTTSQ